MKKRQWRYPLDLKVGPDPSFEATQQRYNHHVSSKDAGMWPGCGLNPDHAIRVVHVSTSSSSLCCRHPNPLYWNAFTALGSDAIVNLSEIRGSEIHQSISGVEANKLSASTIVKSGKPCLIAGVCWSVAFLILLWRNNAPGTVAQQIMKPSTLGSLCSL